MCKYCLRNMQIKGKIVVQKVLSDINEYFEMLGLNLYNKKMNDLLGWKMFI